VRSHAGRHSGAHSGEAEDEPQTRVDPGHRFRRNATDAFSEEAAIGCEDLRDFGDGRLVEASATRWNGDVAGQGAEMFFGCDDKHEDRYDAAAVEGVGLDHEDRPRAAGIGRYGICEGRLTRGRRGTKCWVRSKVESD
jgi:hypothetical protein